MPRTVQNSLRIVTPVLLSLLLTACGGGGDGGGNQNPPPPPAATAPSIVTQPQNRSVTEGDATSFSVNASGTAPLQYQWRRNGINIAAATSAALNLPSVALNENGDSFTVVVTNSAGSVTSAAALLTVAALPPTATAPAITLQPRPESALVGGSATFSVTATGTAPLQYQWLRDSVDVPGANASALTLNSLTLTDNGASFSDRKSVV